VYGMESSLFSGHAVSVVYALDWRRRASLVDPATACWLMASTNRIPRPTPTSLSRAVESFPTWLGGYF
jgi:hypothetical protein